MKEIVYVNTGEVKFGNCNTILNSGAIGSCGAVCIYDSDCVAGAMAHIMLPGESPDIQDNNTRYASNAILELLDLMNRNQSTNLKAFLIGGSNVLRRLNDTIGRSNIDSVEQVLFEKGIRIIGKEVGGYERRTAIFNIGEGVISFTEGDSKQKNIWITGLK